MLAAGCLGVFGVAVAAEPNPSGTVTITSKAIAVGIGVTWGDGKLTYKGQTYTFSVDGLSVVDLGISNVTSSGEVFNLNNVADFSGNYAAGEAGIAIAGGPSDVIMVTNVQCGIFTKFLRPRHAASSSRSECASSDPREARNVPSH